MPHLQRPPQGDVVGQIAAGHEFLGEEEMPASGKDGEEADAVRVLQGLKDGHLSRDVLHHAQSCQASLGHGLDRHQLPAAHVRGQIHAAEGALRGGGGAVGRWKSETASVMMNHGVSFKRPSHHALASS